MKAISYTQVVDLVQMAIEEKGEDYQYQRPWVEAEGASACAYYDMHGQPSCLIGHVLYRMGYVFSPDSEMNLMSADEIFNCLDIALDDRTLKLVSLIQDKQDHGVTWGDSLRTSVDYINRFMPAKPSPVSSNA